MKRLLTIAVVAALCLSLVTTSLGQAAGTKSGTRTGSQQVRAGGSGGGMNQQLISKLNLSAAQKTKVEALNKKTQASMKKVMDDTKLDRAAKQKKMGEIMQSHQKSFSAILTAAQKKTYDAEVKKMTQNRQLGGRGFGGGQVISKLNLSAAQKTKVDALNKKTQASMQKVRDDSKMTREAKGKKFQEIMQSHEKSLLAILTAAQKKTYEAEKKKAQAEMEKRMNERGAGGRTGGRAGGGRRSS